MNEVNPTANPREKEIFLEAIQIQSAADRARYLDQQCGDAHALRASVEALIRNHTESDFLESYAIKLPSPGMSGENIGDIIGRYKLLELIGEGGCGFVYRAEQQQPFRRQVALKVIKPGMDTQHVLQRFERERQALAQLQHSSIAQIYDAGATEKGRPYFVMELIVGTSITHYADAQRLSISERLDLFKRVCSAVQHAHEKGIVHRDIKPSNVLIATESGEPVPKVIDFGIAKPTVGEPARSELLSTATGQLIGTPAYMSPEQAGAGMTESDRRTDIYSLGVLLHELVIGCVPFTLDGLGLYDRLRTIHEKKPELPSTKFKSLPEQEALRIAETRKTEPSRLVDALRGGLDRIVMRCLEKQRDDRYDTAHSLAVDIQSWSSNQAHPGEVTSSIGSKVRTKTTGIPLRDKLTPKRRRKRPSPRAGDSARSASKTGRRAKRQKDSSTPTTTDEKALMAEQGSNQATNEMGGKKQNLSVSAPVEAQSGPPIPQYEPISFTPSVHEVPSHVPLETPISPSSPPPGSNASAPVSLQIPLQVDTASSLVEAPTPSPEKESTASPVPQVPSLPQTAHSVSLSGQVRTSVLSGPVLSPGSSQMVPLTPPADVASLTDNSILPFSLVAPSLRCFRQPDQDSRKVVRPTYSDVCNCTLPRIFSYRALDSCVRTQRCTVICGARGSGKTTVAVQVAIGYTRNSGRVAYLDFAATPVTASLHAVLARLDFTCDVVIVDNAQANRAAEIEILSHCKHKSSKGARFILIELWPRPSTQDLGNVRLNVATEVPIGITKRDFERVLNFWLRQYVPGLPKTQAEHHLDSATYYRFGASLGRFCEALSKRSDTELLGLVTLSSYAWQDARIGVGTEFENITKLPFIDSHFKMDPALNGIRMPLDWLIESLGRSGIDTTAPIILDNFSRLSDRPVFKWYYLLEPLKTVTHFLKRARVKWPGISEGYCRALELDSEFSWRMAMRVIGPKAAELEYIAFAEEYLPFPHTSHISECVLNRGQLYFSNVVAGWKDVRALYFLIRFTRKRLPNCFLLSIKQRLKRFGDRKRLKNALKKLGAESEIAAKLRRLVLSSP